MSNTLGNSLLHQSLYRFAVLEHQSKTSCANSLFQASSAIHKKTFLSTSFRGNCLNVKKKSKIPKGGRNMNYVVPHAVLATNPASELAGRYNLDGISELQIDVTAPTSGSLMQVVIQVSNSSNSLVLHWGGIRDGQKNWVLPSCQPDGSKLYKNRAIRTPFVKSGSSSTVTIEIDDPQIQAIEFLIIEESQNKWFKCNGDNFHVQLAQRAKRSSNSSVPEDLVQIQAYLRWERKGKQMYTPEQEKEEYEAARTELQDELERGLSVEELRSKITKSDGKSKTKEASAPDEKSKTPKKQETNRHYNVEKIQRKRRDFMELLNKYAAESVKENVNNTPKPPTAVELFTKAKEEQYGDSVINKRTFKLGDKKVVALVTKTLGKTKVYLATDFVEPLTLHWALSKNAGEWQAPPTSLLPEGSTLLDQASETQFKKSSSSDPTYQVQSLEIEIGEEDYVGMPFVLLSGGNWMKDSGSDFYVDFKTGPKKVKQNPGGGKGTAKALLDKIADMESEAQKSFMHRFNIAADLVDWAKDAGELGLAGILVWMRFMATRQLTWNKNYNVKPREISKAQDRLTDLLQNVCKSQPQNREILRMIMSTVGRGGEGDVGQRIRDEILVVQRNNNCSGGMMEEWHQKLHNNTSPDDVIICQALIDYIKSDFDISVYWNTLNSNGITKERLLSYDRGIHSEPHFSSDQKNCLLHDLGNYMRTLKAVHSGADLESAIANCMGYKAEGQGFMVGVNINPIVGLPSGFPDLLSFVLNHVEDKNVEPLLESLLEAREELRPSLLNTHDRLRDLLFLDIALDSTVRTVIERGYEELKNAGPEKIMYFISLVLENLALSSDNNEDLIYCLKGWDHAMNLAKGGDSNWALYAKSILDRTRLALTTKAEHYQKILQPSAEYLGSLLGVDKWALSIFTEEMIRAGSAASLSALLNRLDPVLRKTANLGSWQVISPVEVTGYVEVVNELLAVQNKTYERPTILVAKNVRGEEEIPDGTVAVLTPDMPDVLSHVSVRARNSKVCFATCFDPDILSDLQSKEGKLLCLKPTSADVVYSEVKDSELSGASTNSTEDGSLPSISLVKKQFAGRYAISSEEFTSEMVGAKSRNISYIKGKVPSWVGIPTSIALPFGVFEEVLSEGLNKEVAEKLQSLKKRLGNGETETLGEIRKTVLGLAAPPQLREKHSAKATEVMRNTLFKMVQELKNKMQSSDMPWPGDEGEKRWDQAWMAIKKVWASKWNERAYYSTRKVKLDHDFLCMSVLVQEVINADYAFVIHTTNPSSGDSSEIYTEVVKGLGETLVGAYPGRALSFVCKKDDLDSPKLLGYPSKPIGLFIRRSLIFRSDSNGEDLEGYAGAGLYDSVPMDEEEKVVVDYSTDPLIMDSNFRNKILSSIARAGHAIEELYGSAQDIEGVVKDGKIYVVQTRPQM